MSQFLSSMLNVVMLRIVILNDITLSAVIDMLIVVILSVTMPIVAFSYFCAECCYTECHCN